MNDITSVRQTEIVDKDAEIERLRARIDAVRAVLENDDGRGSHSEGWCLGKCLKPKLVAALGGYEQRAELE